MRNVAGPRVELAPNRTIFNLLGPMSNPALVKRQLVGVFDRRWLRAASPRRWAGWGSERALVVHGRTAWTSSRPRPRAGPPRSRTARCAEIEIDAGGSRRAARGAGGAQGRRSRAQCRGHPRGAGAASKDAFRDIVVLNSAAGPDGRRQGGRPEAGRGAGRRVDRRRARPRRRSTTLVRICA